MPTNLITRRDLLRDLLTLPLWAIPLPQSTPGFSLSGWFYQPGRGYYFDTFRDGNSWPAFVTGHWGQAFYLFTGGDTGEFYRETKLRSS